LSDLLFKDIKVSLEENIISIALENKEISICLVNKNLINSFSILKNDKRFAFDQLIDICGVDYPYKEKRFEVVYHLLSMKFNKRIRIKIQLLDNETIDSIHTVHNCANWFEREAWDMYGIQFNNHPNLSRLLSDYDFEGHPLRKDFPLTGYKEIRYSEEDKSLIYNEVDLQQAYRDFDFSSPWGGSNSYTNLPKQ